MALRSEPLHSECSSATRLLRGPWRDESRQGVTQRLEPVTTLLRAQRSKPGFRSHAKSSDFRTPRGEPETAPPRVIRRRGCDPSSTVSILQVGVTGDLDHPCVRSLSSKSRARNAFAGEASTVAHDPPAASGWGNRAGHRRVSMQPGPDDGGRNRPRPCVAARLMRTKKVLGGMAAVKQRC